VYRDNQSGIQATDNIVAMLEQDILGPVLGIT
jgi:hypothetical protein